MFGISLCFVMSESVCLCFVMSESVSLCFVMRESLVVLCVCPFHILWCHIFVFYCYHIYVCLNTNILVKENWVGIFSLCFYEKFFIGFVFQFIRNFLIDE